MKRLLEVGKILLILWGLLSLIATVVFVGIAAFALWGGSQESNKTASINDVQFILNRCNLGGSRIEEVLHSYRSPIVMRGDGVDAHAIRVSHLEATELTRDDAGSGWVRGDQADGVLKDAIEFVLGWAHQDDIWWFPNSDELTSSEMYVYSWSIHFEGTHLSAAQLIFVRPKDKMVFYFDGKT